MIVCGEIGLCRDFNKYLSILDFINKKILRHDKKINAFAVWVFLLCSSAVVTYISGEFQIFIRDYSLVALITIIAFMLFSETWIGDNIRSVSIKICEEIPESRAQLEFYLKKIFNWRRHGIGLLMGLVVVGLVYGFREVFWYSSDLILRFVMVLGFIAGYIFGEAFIGSLNVLRSINRIGNYLIEDTSLFDAKRIKLVKDVVGWGFQISVLTSFMMAFSYPAFFFAPFKGQLTSIVKLLGGVALVLVTALSVFVFLAPTLSIHRAMALKKSEMLQRLYDKVHELYQIFINRSVDEIIKPESQYDFNKLLGSYKIFKENLEELSTWPFDVQTIRKLVGTVAVPILSYASHYLSVILSALGLMI